MVGAKIVRLIMLHQVFISLFERFKQQLITDIDLHRIKACIGNKLTTSPKITAILLVVFGLLIRHTKGNINTSSMVVRLSLANSAAKWKMVYGHHILWSIGGTKYDEGHVLRRLILPTLCEYADAYIAGHEHDLELLTEDCSQYPAASSKSPLPLIISGAASKMRGVHTPFAEYQARQFPQYKLIWHKAFTWGFARVEAGDELTVEFYTTPKDLSGKLVEQSSFTFERRSD